MSSFFKITVALICALFLIAACQENSDQTEFNDRKVENTAAEGFNADSSDAKAIAIADSVMQAMGGRQQWDDTKIISWNFFGRRTHTWDKNSGKDRLEIPDQNLVIQFDTETKEGWVMKNGEELSQPDSVAKYLQQGYQMWVNDAYWLVMPYKLKDSGVTLNYMGMDSTQSGMSAHKLKLTFENIGLTPDNMYHVYVDTVDHLVRQWAFFPEAIMDKPQFILPWDDYREYGDIMLSGNRGQYTLSDIQVMDEWPFDE